MQLTLFSWFSFNVPIWDDYDAILRSILRFEDAQSIKEWFAVLFSQHNEHRIIVTRLVARVWAALFGEVNFQYMALFGNFFLVGIYLLAWREFKQRVPPTIIGAGAFLVFQWSYFESATMGMTAISNFGVVFFSFSCLMLVMRRGVLAVTISILLGVLAAGSQANGIFALPIAASGCWFAGMRQRAFVVALISTIVFISYFSNYYHPPNHPSALEVLRHPFDGLYLFLVIVGGLFPSEIVAAFLGMGILTGIALFALHKKWREYPIASLWIIFLLLSAASAAVGRVGFGVHFASRYAIYPTCFVVILFMTYYRFVFAMFRIPVAVVPFGAAAVSLLVTGSSWADISKRHFQGMLLTEGMPVSAELSAPRFGAMQYPDSAAATKILSDALARGLYRIPSASLLFPSSVQVAPTSPSTERNAGVIDEVKTSGSLVEVVGWTDLPANVPAREFYVFGVAGNVRARLPEVRAREDVAIHLNRRNAVYSGFAIKLEFGTEEEARRAADTLCVTVMAPNMPSTKLWRLNVDCN